MELWDELGATITVLREDAPNPLVRSLCTFAAGVGCAALACAGLWGFAVSGTRWVRDDHVAFALLVAALPWLGAAWFIWRPYRACRPLLDAILITLAVPASALVVLFIIAMNGFLRRWMATAAILSLIVGSLVVVGSWTAFLRRSSKSELARSAVTRAAIRSVGIIVLAIGLAVLVDEFGPRWESEFAVAGVLLLGGALLVVTWIPHLARVRRRKVVDESDLVNIRCPSCGYSLIGLRELRCPECGTEFVLDELIRAQEYDISRPREPRDAAVVR